MLTLNIEPLTDDQITTQAYLTLNFIRLFVNASLNKLHDRLSVLILCKKELSNKNSYCLSTDQPILLVILSRLLSLNHVQRITDRLR